MTSIATCLNTSGRLITMSGIIMSAIMIILGGRLIDPFQGERRDGRTIQDLSAGIASC